MFFDLPPQSGEASVPRVSTQEYIDHVIKHGRIRIAPFHLLEDDRSLAGEELLNYERQTDNPPEV